MRQPRAANYGTRWAEVSQLKPLGGEAPPPTLTSLLSWKGPGATVAAVACCSDAGKGSFRADCKELALRRLGVRRRAGRHRIAEASLLERARELN